MKRMALYATVLIAAAGLASAPAAQAWGCKGHQTVALIAEKIAKGPSGRRFGADPGKPLGDHPTLGGIAVKSGRYGAYVTSGGVNATIPSDKTQDTITLPEAIALIDERVAKGGAKPKRVAKAKAAKPAKGEADAKAPKPVKKAAVKKAAAKPKSDAVSKARAPVISAVKISPAQPAAASKTPAKKSAGKARG